MTTYDGGEDYEGDWTYYGAVYGEDEIALLVEMDLTYDKFALVEDLEFTGEQYESAYEYNDPDGPLGVGQPIQYSGASVSWTDITDQVMSVSINRGKSSLTSDYFEAGSASIVLRDFNADFIPGNTASQYYPNVRPMRPIRITGVFSGEYTRLFRGYVDTWEVNWDPNQQVSIVTIQATDAYKILSNYFTAEAGADLDTPGQRVTDILASISWPTAFQDIDASGYESQLAQGSGVSVSALSALQDVEYAEAGALFITGEGKVRFMNQDNAYPSTVTHTMSDVGGDGVIQFENIQLGISDEQLYNVVTLTNIYGDVGTTNDQDSEDEYTTKELSRSDVLTYDQSNTEALAQFYLERSKQPIERISSITVDGRISLSNMALIQRYELLEVASVSLTVPGGYAMTKDVYLTSVQHDIRPRYWKVTFTTSHVFIPTQQWQDITTSTTEWGDVGAAVTWQSLGFSERIA